MATDPVFDAIKAHLVANWTTTPLAYPNEWSDPAEGAGWVYFEIAGTDYDQVSIGAGSQAANRWDEEGMLWLHVMVPRGTGESEARADARALARLFRGAQLLSGNLEFGRASVGIGEPGDETGNWHRITTSVEWRWIDAA